MAPRRQKGVDKANKDSKRRDLITAYDIVFDGPIPRRKWPSRYAPIFQKIRDIESVKYEDYIEILTSQQTETHDSLRPIPERVAELIRVAYDMRNSLANEATWRSHTEHLVLNRFHHDRPCDYCHKRRWFSNFKLDPLCSTAADKLRVKRAKTTLCRGGHGDRGGYQSANELQLPYSFRGNEPVIDESVPEYRTREFGALRPDYVIGLRKTAKLRSLLSSKPDIIDTPFEKRASPSFPFLLLEAKAEHGCPGFTSVEEQSAFPLRTLLNIQKKIPTTAEIGFDPLVWFIANQGDEWRIYACIPEGSKTRIIDLWHGSVLRDDSTLQLLLIVDMICDWARNIYRKEIMKCFAFAMSHSRGLTPADSLISYNPISEEEASANQSNDYSLSEDNDYIVSRVEDNQDRDSTGTASPDGLGGSEDDDMAISDPITEDILTPSTTPDNGIVSPGPLAVSDVEMVEPGPEDGSEITISDVWTQHAVIRHANNIIYSFQTLSLPEKEDDLIKLLTSSSTTSDIAQTAGNFVKLFWGRNKILMQKKTIPHLEAWWTGGRIFSSRKPDENDIVVTHFSFEAYFRRDDWELVRKLTCIMASSTTIQKLELISGLGHQVMINYKGVSSCSKSNFLNATCFLRDLSYQRSAKSGISNLHLYLRQIYTSSDVGRLQYEWRKSTPQITDVLDALKYNEPSTTVERHGQVKSSKFFPQTMSLNLEFGPKAKTIGAFLAKKLASWPDSCPKYCLIVFDGADIQDGHAMASKILDSILNKNFFHEPENGLSQVEASALMLWADILCGKAPLDSIWPA